MVTKSDSFFVRASVTTNGTTYAQSAIDMGAYVDALGKSVVRLHNIAVRYNVPGSPASPAASGTYNFQLTTQSQTALVGLDDKSVIASGTLLQVVDGTSMVVQDDSIDVAPQSWRNGYLVGVEQLYLGTQNGGTAVLGDGDIEIVLECTVETLSQSAAMALALSQQ